MGSGPFWGAQAAAPGARQASRLFGFQLQAVSEPERVCTLNIILVKLIEGFYRAFSVGFKHCFSCQGLCHCHSTAGTHRGQLLQPAMEEAGSGPRAAGSRPPTSGIQLGAKGKQRPPKKADPPWLAGLGPARRALSCCSWPRTDPLTQPARNPTSKKARLMASWGSPGSPKSTRFSIPILHCTARQQPA